MKFMVGFCQVFHHKAVLSAHFSGRKRWAIKEETVAYGTTKIRYYIAPQKTILQWRHNVHDGVSNHRRFDCLLNGLFRRR